MWAEAFEINVELHMHAKRYRNQTQEIMSCAELAEVFSETLSISGYDE